ncbi:MAG: hypothetical protein II124_02515 [Clostridia bacterium]|nr:hypothetical protein [Clostridia bacterium]MBQ2517190.1 hypothetical protein [Clostridia bacterium]
MMKRLRIAILAFFLVVAAVFTYTLVKRRATVDYYAPVIAFDEDVLQVSVSATDADLLAGVTARDNLDGDVTDTLVVTSRSKFASKGRLHVNYAAFDSNKNVGTASREVIYTDYVSPHFHLYEPLRYASGTSGNDFLENITAEDCLDGNLTQQIKISFGNTSVVSSGATKQHINIQVTNSGGDTAALELTVSMEDYLLFSQMAPALKDYIAYMSPGQAVNFRSFIVGVWSAGNVRSFDDTRFTSANITVDESGLDRNTPGVYTVVYRLNGLDGEALGTAELIVVVEG